MSYDPTPTQGCIGYQGTAGRLGCPKHSPNVYIADQPKPFSQIILRCPWCGKDIQMDCFKIELAESEKL